MNEQALLDAWWERPGDETLRVLADAWLEKNEKRGLFVQLSLTKNRTPAQEKKYQSLLRKKGELVGPARPFLREYEFGPNGVVHKARCEADKLVEGLEHLTRLNPELMLCVTSLKKKATIDAVAKLDLARLHFVTFTTHLIGSMGGSNLTDKTLVGVAPAFRGVKHLGLQARGFLPDCFTPAGLARFADHLEGLEYFELDHHPRAAEPDREPLPPLEKYVDVVLTHRAFKSLKAVAISGADEAALRALPNMVTVIGGDLLRHTPKTAQQLAALKSR